MTKQQVVAKIKEQIDSLVKEHGQCESPEGKVFFRKELELLVLLAERGQMEADYEATMEMLKGGLND